MSELAADRFGHTDHDGHIRADQLSCERATTSGLAEVTAIKYGHPKFETFLLEVVLQIGDRVRDWRSAVGAELQMGAADGGTVAEKMNYVRLEETNPICEGLSGYEGHHWDRKPLNVVKQRLLPDDNVEVQFEGLRLISLLSRCIK